MSKQGPEGPPSREEKRKKAKRWHQVLRKATVTLAARPGLQKALGCRNF